MKIEIKSSEAFYLVIAALVFKIIFPEVSTVFSASFIGAVVGARIYSKLKETDNPEEKIGSSLVKPEDLPPKKEKDLKHTKEDDQLVIEANIAFNSQDYDLLYDLIREINSLEKRDDLIKSQAKRASSQSELDIQILLILFQVSLEENISSRIILNILDSIAEVSCYIPANAKLVVDTYNKLNEPRHDSAIGFFSGYFVSQVLYFTQKAYFSNDASNDSIVKKDKIKLLFDICEGLEDGTLAKDRIQEGLKRLTLA